MGSSIYKLNTKSIARLAAVQTYYNYQVNTDNQDIQMSLDQITAYYKDQENIYEDYDLEEMVAEKNQISIKPSYSFLEKLISCTDDNIDDIDKTISGNLKENWSLNRLPILTLAVLRVAIGEMHYLKETPIKVVINEYTNIANDLLDEREVGFVNSLLDKVSKEK